MLTSALTLKCSAFPVDTHHRIHTLNYSRSLRIHKRKYSQSPTIDTRKYSQSTIVSFGNPRRTGQLKHRITMADSNSAQTQNPSSVQERITLPNKHGEKLVGVLDDTGSRQLVVLCHGFRSSKESDTLVNLAAALVSEGISVFRFDFSGNGESEGQFQYGNYWKEVEDLHTAILYFSGKERKVNTILGHSKGNVEYCVTKESLMDRLQTDMKSAALSIPKNCKVLTIHGSTDEVIPVTDAFEFDKLITNHVLQVIDGADHGYSFHQNELASVVVNFIKSS